MKFQDTLHNAKTTVKDCTDFAVQGITNICKLYGPRPCGDESEKNAQLKMMNEIEDYCDEARRETFKVNPDAFMSFVPIAGTLVGAAAGLNIFALGRIAHNTEKN